MAVQQSESVLGWRSHWQLHEGVDVLHTKSTDDFSREDSIPGTERSLCRCLEGCEIKLEKWDQGLEYQVGFFQ